MASKVVTDRQKSADAVAAIADAQGGTLASAAAQVMGASSDGEIRSVLGQLTAALIASRDAMVRADTVHESELADDSGVRDERDVAMGELSSTLVELREVMTGLYGAKVASEVFVGSTPQDPVVLERFAGEVVSNLQRISLPASRIAGASLDVPTLNQKIDTARSTLKDKLEAVAREVREGQDTLSKKNKAIEEYDRVFRGVATTLSGLFTLAGEEELASKVRPSLRRPGQTQQQEQDAR